MTFTLQMGNRLNLAVTRRSGDAKPLLETLDLDPDLWSDAVWRDTGKDGSQHRTFLFIDVTVAEGDPFEELQLTLVETPVFGQGMEKAVLDEVARRAAVVLHRSSSRSR